jgi:general secretion pathway protein G
LLAIHVGPALLRLVAMASIPVAVLWIVLGLNAQPVRDRNRTRYFIAILQLTELTRAVDHYKADCGNYPIQNEGLTALVFDRRVKGWKGPYLKEVPHDPWGRPYLYSRSSDSEAPEIRSYGADGVPGGEFFDQDISNRDLKRVMPTSPYELRMRRFLTGSWIGAWLVLIGSIYVLRKTSPIIRSEKSNTRTG